MATAKNEILTMVFIDAITGETIERELTSEEIAERNERIANANAEKAAAQAKAAARQSALSKLAELGLTEEEIAALV